MKKQRCHHSYSQPNVVKIQERCKYCGVSFKGLETHLARNEVCKKAKMDEEAGLANIAMQQLQQQQAEMAAMQLAENDGNDGGGDGDGGGEYDPAMSEDDDDDPQPRCINEPRCICQTG